MRSVRNICFLASIFTLPRITAVLGLSLTLLVAEGSSQVTLQPWTEVEGTTNGQQLGKNVTGIVSTTNFPFRAAVSRNGITGVYSLQSPTDTMVQMTFLGENLLTGDLNGDTFTDVVVTKTVDGWDTVYVYWGTESSIDTANPLRIPGENRLDLFAARCIGDANNDGFLDLIVSAPYFPPSPPQELGKLYVFLGPNLSDTADLVVLGDTTTYHLGTRIHIGDLNDDSFNDLVAQGYVTFPSGDFKYTRIYWGETDTLTFEDPTELIGLSDALGGISVFDSNGDGIDDLLWTNRNAANLSDQVWIHFGGSALDTIPNLIFDDPGVANFGQGIINGGDMNGDGYDDVVVSAPSATITSGFVFVYGGGPTIDGNFDAAVGKSTNGDFGRSLSSVGDVSGDGLSDIIVGAPKFAFQNEKGYWGIFLGDSSILVSDVKQDTSYPTTVQLLEAYPNPFNPSTTFSFTIPQSSLINLSVYNLLGREIVTLVNEKRAAGTYTEQWDAAGLPSGVYFYRMRAGDFVETKKLVLVR